MSLMNETPAPTARDRRGGYPRGIGDVMVLELRQRLRSRGWYIMLAIWFFIIGLVTLLTWSSWNAARIPRRPSAAR
ncbi:MAG: hypothetical protein M3017_11090 [Actinomycetota bacterium]|nr:hypothetical protein [Actinomycetota bacterium]